MLTGGGARGAYQIGVLKAISELYPRNHGIPFPIVCGTSAGSINATALACYASCFRLGVKKLESIWGRFHCHQVYHSDFIRMTAQLLRMATRGLRADYATKHSFSLLNNRPLRDLLDAYLPYARIERNVHQGHLHALSINASDYATTNNVSFFQGHHSLKQWHSHSRYSQRVKINTNQLMASAAVPIVFPAIRVNQSYFGDGSVHQPSPLSPAIQLGADKILCIHLKPQSQFSASSKLTRAPNSADIAGKLLDGIFSDTLDSDLDQLQRINFSLDQMDSHHQHELKLRPIETLSIRPQHDFDAIAQAHFECFPFAMRSILRTVGINQNSSSSIASYLLFEARHTQELMRCGYIDGQAMANEIFEFLKPETN
ncbi:patatin-like phospholipase family protein [Alginatibacterium sediminis]|uniref:Patatin-like phospholipase family protein n=2 Tax=Alginatibacterium sediminis TaxID=2164068 RepID=A0A420E922_9ALTE|nr:patatin-like phospholipase family protein [Alginatibacterium sediminis]